MGAQPSDTSVKFTRKLRWSLHMAMAATTGQEGHWPGPGKLLKGLSLGCTETSDLKMKVATLERELKQQLETTQDVGKEPCHIAPYHMPCIWWYHRMSTISLCTLGFWGKDKEPQRR